MDYWIITFFVSLMRHVHAIYFMYETEASVQFAYAYVLVLARARKDKLLSFRVSIKIAVSLSPFGKQKCKLFGI